MNDIDFAIIGAGPAGLAAATFAAELGLEAAVFDEAASPGGQIYRGVEAALPRQMAILGGGYREGARLVAAFRASGARYSPNTTVWQVTRDRRIGIARDGRASFVRAGRVLIATGAQERAMPISGWTLPGVMTAGGAQTLLKSSGLAPKGPVVLAGNGPLLYLLGAQLAAAQVPVAAILDTGTRYWSALPQLPGALMAGGYIAKGAAMLRASRRFKHFRGVSGLRAMGGDRLKEVAFDMAGRMHVIPASLLCLHQGVVSNVQLTASIPLKHEWNEAQRCWRPACDEWGSTDMEGIAVAGDCAGIVGAEASVHAGRLAALEAARALGKIDARSRDERAVGDRAKLRRHLRARPFLDALYPPGREFLNPPDVVTVCRCEEVTAGQVRRAAREGCAGPDQAKALTRAGMGPCQGRMCALTVAEIVAAATGRPASAIAPHRIRAPVKPLTVPELIALDALAPSK